jgi:two-component system response regulator MprA
MRILVADDAGTLGPTCIVFLAYWGHEVEVARDGLEALRKARAWRPDLVLAHAGLERLDGVRLLSALRAGGGLPDTEVALVGAEGHVREMARRLGAAGFLDAPLVVPELARLVERVAAGRRQPTASAYVLTR